MWPDPEDLYGSAVHPTYGGTYGGRRPTAVVGAERIVHRLMVSGHRLLGSGICSTAGSRSCSAPGVVSPCIKPVPRAPLNVSSLTIVGPANGGVCLSCRLPVH